MKVTMAEKFESEFPDQTRLDPTMPDLLKTVTGPTPPDTARYTNSGLDFSGRKCATVALLFLIGIAL
jgi:hypothetical protein